MTYDGLQVDFHISEFLFVFFGELFPWDEQTDEILATESWQTEIWFDMYTGRLWQVKRDFWQCFYDNERDYGKHL